MQLTSDDRRRRARSLQPTNRPERCSLWKIWIARALLGPATARVSTSHLKTYNSTPTGPIEFLEGRFRFRAYERLADKNGFMRQPLGFENHERYSVSKLSCNIFDNGDAAYLSVTTSMYAPLVALPAVLSAVQVSAVCDTRRVPAVAAESVWNLQAATSL